MKIRKKLIDDVELSEIDMDLHESFGYTYEDDDPDFEFFKEGYGDVDTYPIDIDKVLNLLNSFKEKGATHVEMDYHCDHVGYLFSAYTLSLMSNEELKEINKIKNKKQEEEKQRQIILLQEEINRLKNEK